MADSKLSALTAAASATGTDEIYLNNGASRKITVIDFLANLIDPIITTDDITCSQLIALADIVGGGNLELAGYVRKSTQDGMAAAGATQGTATLLSSQVNRVTTVVATTDDGVMLPAALSGIEVLVINAHATDALAIWPNTGDAIDGGAVDAEDASPLVAGSHRRYVALDSTNWYTV